MASLIRAARGAQSSLPLYAAMGLAAVTGLWVKGVLGIRAKTGLVEALLALSALGAAYFFDRRRAWQEMAPLDSLLGRNFPLRDSRFLPSSFDTGALVAALASMKRALVAFAPLGPVVTLVEDPRVALSFAIDTTAIWGLARRFSSLILARFLCVPLTAFWASVLLSVPVVELRPPALILIVALILWTREWLLETEPGDDVVVRAWQRVWGILIAGALRQAFSLTCRWRIARTGTACPSRTSSLPCSRSCSSN